MVLWKINKTDKLLARLIKKKKREDSNKYNYEWKQRHYHRYHTNTNDPKRLLCLLVHQQIGHLEQIDKFIESYNLQRLNYEEIGNLNRSIMSKKIESAIKTSQQRKAEDQVVSPVNSTNIYRRISANFLHTLPKIGERKHFQTHFYETCITIARKGQYKKSAPQ